MRRLAVGSVIISLRQTGKVWEVKATEYGETAIRQTFSLYRPAALAYDYLVRRAYEYLWFTESH